MLSPNFALSPRRGNGAQPGNNTMTIPTDPTAGKPTDINDARAFKNMGLPLNTPVEHREFAPESTKLYLALWGDLTEFCNKMYAYHDRSTPKTFRAWKRALTKIDRDAKALFDYAVDLKSAEGDVLLGFLLHRVTPFTEGWAEVFGALEDGEEVQIEPINKWEWNPLEAQQ
jgi:hypothetical protein